MATWIFEPGHTEAEFRARHMMVTWVRGLFKDIHGSMQLSWQDELPGGGVVVGNEIEVILDAEALLLDDLERTGAIEYYRP